MANIKSAKKRIDTINRNTEYNKSNKSEMKTEIKKVNKAVSEGNKKDAEKALISATSTIDKNASRGVIHKNKANRKKAQIAKVVNSMNK